MNVVAKGTRALSSAARSSSRSFFTRSILLSASSGAPCRPAACRECARHPRRCPWPHRPPAATMIGVARPAPGRVHHRPVEPPPRREDAGRVDEHELACALDGDAAQRHARRLHLVADDRDLGADQRVDQRRLAGVGRADHGDEAAACCRPSASGIGHSSLASTRPRARAAPWQRPARRRACWRPRRARACGP